MCMPGGGGNDGAKEARERDEARAARIRDGASRIGATFGQFDGGFYGQRRQAYLDFAMPQFNDQYADAKKQLTFALSRGGNLSSTVAGERMAKLKQGYDRGLLDIQGRGQDYATQARQAVEENRSALMSSLNATGDADAAANGAAARAVMLGGIPSFSQLGPYFQNVTAGLAAAQTDPEGYQGLGSRLFQDRGRAGSGLVVRG